ncbi:hypothetical protein [Deinococcus pimensis]|uniref:hypothetical protein n=1 Tax=Deinococcus pimensis TaxID=309888 RepID=UPI000489F4AF|nr:hypothetical protein [Deinococcus pimensis]
MTRRRLPVLGLALLLSAAALAQTSTPPATPDTPAGPPVSTTVTGAAASARTTTGAAGVKVDLTLRNTTATDVALMAGRSNSQQCAFPPHVRVLRVGTREVVYPSGEPRICTQELRTETVTANGTLTLSRTLDLPAGEYVVEVWWQGFANDEAAKVPAQPVRVTVQ